MIKRYQSTWNIWSTCTNTLCYQLKYFLFLFGFTLLAARYDLFLTGTAILSSDNTALAGMRKSCGQSCHLNRDEKEVGGHWSGPGGKVNPTVSYGPEQLSTTAGGGLGCTAHHAGFHLLTFKPKHGRHVTWEKSKYTKTLSQTQSIGTKIGVVTHNLWHVKIAKKDIAGDSELVNTGSGCELKSSYFASNGHR